MDQHNARTRWLLSRRTFLRLSGLAGIAGVGTLITACGGTTPTATTAAKSTTSSAAAPASTTSAAATTATSSAAGGAATTKAATTSSAASSAASSSAAATSATASTSASTPNIPKSFKEAPTLADQVKAGKLPPVEQRLPRTPLVVQPNESVGKFGGTWRTALVGGQDTAWLTRTIGYNFLVRWDTAWKQVIPNVAESFQANPDATEFTFKLREGMKWSDGQPFGVDDLIFYGEDVYGNSELTTSKGTNPFTITKVDDLTVKVTFQKPNGLFLQNLATPSGADWTRFPAHYLKQFHKKYADPAKLDQLIKQNNADSWVKLFRLKGWGVPGTPYDALWSNPDLPTLYVWKIVEPYGNGTRVTCERNPFFWKVDPDGNQLPYIDKVAYDVLQDPQPLVLKVANGEIDFHDRHINNNQNKSVLSDNQQKGQYHFVDTNPSGSNTTAIAFNLTHKDAAMRKLFQDKQFRIAMSYAIDRKQLIDTVFVSQGEAWQDAPQKESIYYNETLAKQYTEYDVNKATQTMTQAGYKKGPDGMWLRTDGQKISFVVEVSASGVDATNSDVMKIVVDQWRKFGIDAQLKPEDRSLLYTRKDANEHDCVIWGGSGGLLDAILDPRNYLPFSDESNYAEGWYVWYYKPSNPQAEAQEPPDAVKKQMDLYQNSVLGSGDADKQKAAFLEVLKTAQDEFYVIGISLPSSGYAIVKNNFKNVPKEMPDAWLYPTPAPTNPEQYYFA
ncbi:MAG: ABC transporter substrate-binding protein [Thermomicrobiales bacterium]